MDPRRAVSLIILFSLLGLSKVHGQILDDSTKQVFGPETTSFTTEKHIKYDDPVAYSVDTLIDNKHRHSYMNKVNNTMQDLGNIGTAIRPLYYQIPDVIGRTSGFGSFDHYSINPVDIRYFDTKSPYSRLGVTFGGNGRSLVDVSFSRSDSTVFNVGFDFKRITSDKQVGELQSRGDHNVLATIYDIYARWNPGKYLLLFNYSRMRHQQFESGGVMPLPSGSLDNLFLNDSANVWLNSAVSEDKRSNIHLYHQFQVHELFQIYHQFDYSPQRIKFEDPDLANDGPFFDQFLISETETSDASSFETIRNEVGIKGKHRGIFYNFYLTKRDIQYIPKYLPAEGFVNEYYLGSNLRYVLGGQTLEFEGEAQDGGSYKLKGSFSNSFIEASYTRVQYDPTFLHNDYFGNHREWHLDFTSPAADVLEGRLKLETDNFQFHPKITITNVNDHIFYNQDRLPEQASGAAQILSPELLFNWRFMKRIELSVQAIYTTITGEAEEVFRIPEWLINSQLSYRNNIFNDKLELQFGIDTQYRSSFFGHDYDPTIQQFFLQDHFNIPDYFIADVFVNFKVGRALLFAKLVFANQGLSIPGYFTAPYYLGQQRVFDWGITWQFYD
jgi:hypothetical protein